MGLTPISGGLRMATALLVLLTIVGSGLLRRSPWVLGLYTPVLTALYAAGNWSAWQAAKARGGWLQLLAAVGVTAPLQLLVASVPYLVGYGLGALLGETARPAGSAPWTCS